MNRPPDQETTMDTALLPIHLSPERLHEAVRQAVHAALDEREHKQGATLSVPQARRRAACRSEVIYSALQSGALRAQRMGRRWRIDPTTLAAWVAAGRPI